MNRRTLLKAAALAPVATALGTPAAHARLGHTMMIVSPHPDDETLRLASLALHRARRGDRMVLVAVTDGEASSVATRLGLTRTELAAIRRGEQARAWSALTYGRGTIVRLGQADGGVVESAVRTRLASLVTTYGASQTSLWVAATASDAHPDHVKVSRAAASCGARVVRYGLEPGQTNATSTLWTCPDLASARAADEAYRRIGWVSVPGLFRSLRAASYASRTI